MPKGTKKGTKKCSKIVRKWDRDYNESTENEVKKTEKYRHSLKCDYVSCGQKSNGDLKRYCNSGYIGSFTKGLPHDSQGIVDNEAFLLLLKVIKCNTVKLWSSLVLGPPLTGYTKALLANPQSAFFSTGIGFNVSAVSCPPAPRLSSLEAGADMVELYFMANSRDIPFIDYSSQINPSALVGLQGYKGPTPVTTENIFRGNSAGDLIGPYISQLLLLSCPMIVGSIPQTYLELNAGIDYLTDRTEWLNAQNGNIKTAQSFSAIKKYIYTGRQLANYVHVDPPCQPWINAANILIGLKSPLDNNNPYVSVAGGTTPGGLSPSGIYSASQGGFVTFGIADLHAMIAEVSQLSLAFAWNTKWRLELRLRPEAFGGLVDDQVRLGINRDLPSNLINSPILATVGLTKLLSQAYPEGSPLHPSYPSGHAATAGACATILKAWFNESTIFASPVQASSDGLSLIPYSGADLLLNNELDKMASNMAYGRNFAGIHYRSDAEEGILLGERIAIEYLKQRKRSYNEKFKGFELTTRFGKKIIIR